MIFTIPAFKRASYYTEEKEDHPTLQTRPTGSFLKLLSNWNTVPKGIISSSDRFAHGMLGIFKHHCVS